MPFGTFPRTTSDFPLYDNFFFVFRFLAFSGRRRTPLGVEQYILLIAYIAQRSTTTCTSPPPPPPLLRISKHTSSTTLTRHRRPRRTADFLVNEFCRLPYCSNAFEPKKSGVRPAPGENIHLNVPATITAFSVDA